MHPATLIVLMLAAGTLNSDTAAKINSIQILQRCFVLSRVIAEYPRSSLIHAFGCSSLELGGFNPENLVKRGFYFVVNSRWPLLLSNMDTRIPCGMKVFAIQARWKSILGE